MFGREFIRISGCQKTAIIVQSISPSQSQDTVSAQCPVSKEINNDANTHFAHACLRDWIYKCIHLHSKQVESAEFVVLRPPVVYLFYHFRAGFFLIISQGQTLWRFLCTVQLQKAMNNL